MIKGTFLQDINEFINNNDDPIDDEVNDRKIADKKYKMKAQRLMDIRARQRKEKMLQGISQFLKEKIEAK